MELPKRKRNRLKNYDYSNGMYFVTICTENHRKILCGVVGDGSPVPKEPGKIAEEFILKIPEKYTGVKVDKYVVMPNHVHLLIYIGNKSVTEKPSPTLGDIIGWYKYQVTKQINNEMGIPGRRFFQRSFHDHVIRGEKDYLKIWEYIDNNPARWAEDCFYTE